MGDNTADDRRRVMAILKLSQTAKLVAIRIMDLQGLKLKASIKTARGLGEDVGVGQDRVRKALRELRAHGLLEEEHVPGRVTRRRVNTDSLKTPGPRVGNAPGSETPRGRKRPGDPGSEVTPGRKRPGVGNAPETPGRKRPGDPGSETPRSIQEHQGEHHGELLPLTPSEDADGSEEPPVRLVRDGGLEVSPGERRRVAAKRSAEHRAEGARGRSEDDRLAMASRLAVRSALEAKGLIYDRPDHAVHLKVGRMVAAWCDRHEADLQQTLDSWATDWTGAAERLVASVWELYVASRVAGKPWGPRGSRRKTDRLPPGSGEGFDDGDFPAPPPRISHA